MTRSGVSVVIGVVLALCVAGAVLDIGAGAVVAGAAESVPVAPAVAAAANGNADAVGAGATVAASAVPSSPVSADAGVEGELDSAAAPASWTVTGLIAAWFWLVSIWSFKLGFWLLVAILSAVWWFQGQLLYLPQFQGRSGERRALKYNSAGLRSPAEQQLPFEEHFIPTPDGPLVHTWLVFQQPDSIRIVAPTIIFFHGNAGNIGFRIPNAKTLYYTTGCNVLLVDYRGYGNSTGTPSEAGLKRDAQACLDFLLKRNDIDPRKIFVFGQSLGGGVATDLAYRNQDTVRGLILENTFTSIDDMVITIVGRMGYNLTASKSVETAVRTFLRFFMTSHWYNRTLIRSIRIPILFISGLADELVPPAQMRELHDLAESSARTWIGIEGGEHNATYIQGAPQYFEGFAAFVSRVIG